MASAITQQPTGYERGGHNGWSKIKIKSRGKKKVNLVQKRFTNTFPGGGILVWIVSGEHDTNGGEEAKSTRKARKNLQY
jgi:hypothetical protein